MAMSSLAAAKNRYFLSRLRTLLTFQNFSHTLTERCRSPVFKRGEIEFSKWRKLDAREMGIHQSMIPMPPWTVLKTLKMAGFEAYFVGGCVRDLLLNRVPKDFDVITTAALTQVRKRFHGSMIIGRRFPICQVNIRGSVVEVSSFQTVAQHNEGRDDKFSVSQLPKGCDKKDLARWRDCMRRDFTVNSLFFDPFVNKIYDYADALSDLKLSRLRTLIPAELSFEEDRARILRALRLAARLGLSFSEDTESAMHKLSSSILSLAKSRILMELNYMLSYGAAEPSLSFLRRFHLLEILLPLQEAHLTQQARISGQNPLMLMKLFSNLDKFVSCDRPAASSLWVAILAFHWALISNPQHPLVVLTFASVLFHGKWNKGVKFARQHAQEVQIYIPEIACCSDSISDDELANKVSELAVEVQNSVHILSEAEILLKEMAKFPAAQCPGLVSLSKKMGDSANQIFEVLAKDLTSLRTTRASLEINYDSLKKGNVHETRFVLGQIILHTLGCEPAIRDEVMKKDKIRLPALDPEKNAEMLAENSALVVDRRKKIDKKRAIKPANFVEEQIVSKKQLFKKIGKNAEILAENSPLVVDRRKKTDKKCAIKPANFEEEQIVSKKQKLFEKIGGLSEQGRDMDQMLTADTEPVDLDEKKQDLLEDDLCSEVAKKYRKVKSKVTSSLLPEKNAEMLAENSPLVVDRRKKTDKKRTIKPANFVEEQIVSKKQKLFEKIGGFSEQGRDMDQMLTADTEPVDLDEKKQDLLEDGLCSEVAKKYRKVKSKVTGSLLPEKNAEMLAENSPLVVDRRKKTDKKRTIKPANFVEEQIVSKKQKLFEKIGGLSEQGRDMDQMLTADTEPVDLDEKKQDLLEDGLCSEVAKKYRKVKSKVTGSLLPEKNAEMLAENSPLVVDRRKKTDKKRTIKPANFVEEQIVSKKQKLFEKIGGLSEQGRDMDQMLTADTEPVDLDEKKQDLLEDDLCSEVAKMYCKVKSKVTGSLLQVYASKMLEKADSHGVPREEIKSMLETLELQVRKHEAPVKEQKTSDDEEYKKSAEKHLKLLEQLSNEAAMKQPKFKESCLLQQEPDIEQQNVGVEYIRGKVQQNMRVLEKGRSHKKEKLKGRPQTLSSLFR